MCQQMRVQLQGRDSEDELACDEEEISSLINTVLDTRLQRIT